MSAVNTERFVQLLRALQSSENQHRQEAERMYQQAKVTEPDGLIVGLLSAVGCGSADDSCRTQGLVLLRQLVTPGPEANYVFARLSPGSKAEVAAELLRRFEMETNQKVQQAIANVIAQLAEGVSDGEDRRGWVNLEQRGWPQLLQLIFRMADPTTNPVASSCESSLRLLKDLVSTLKEEFGSAQQQVGTIIKNSLAHSEVKIRCAVFLLICEMVTELDEGMWTPLTATAPVLHQLLRNLAESQLDDELRECLQAFVVVVDDEPDFFKQQLTQSMEPAKLFQTLVQTSAVETGIRKLSLEWLVSFAEKKPKFVAKHVPDFVALVLQCCIVAMLEVDSSDEEVKDWCERMDDEEGEEDADELHQVGAEAIDRFVESMGIDAVGTALFAAVGQCAKEESWQAKLAAMTAIRQTIEYVEDHDHVNEVVSLLLPYVKHPHPRVRYAALHAIGQVGQDQAPHFQESTHETLMPILLSQFNDPVDRVASMAMSAFVTYGGELDSSLMIGYSHKFMEKLVERLQSSKHRMIQEECVTSIAVIAGVLEDDFSQYYDGMMPILKQFVLHANGEKEQRLRGKAFECMSLLGVSVGKERFLPDAREAIGEMLKTTLEGDDVQRDYIKEASERICKVLKRDFAPFLEHMLPGMMKTLVLDTGIATGQDNAAADDDDDCADVLLGEKLVKVHSSKFEEISNSLQLLHVFCDETEGDFLPYIPTVAQALLPFFSATDSMGLLDDLRGLAVQTWALLIKCARSGAKERGLEATLANELSRTALQNTCKVMQEEEDPETLGASALGLAECLKNMGPGVLSAAEVLQLVRQIFKFIDDSHQRVATAKREKTKKAQDDEEPDTLDEDEEELCRRNLEDTLGAVMEIAPTEFCQCLPECVQHIGQWLQIKENAPLALFLACDLVRHLKEESQQTWPVFMPAVFAALAGPDPDVRIPAAWLINLAAPLNGFQEAAPEAFRALAKIVSSQVPKKKTRKNEQAHVAMENAIAALLTLARYQASSCPVEVPAWQLVVSKLPLKKDEDEGKKVHEAVVDLVLEQHSGLLGQDNANLGSILSCLAEIHRSEDLSSKTIDEKIVRVFQHLPQDVLIKYASNFSGKQQAKIRKIVQPSA
jgi:hypothetical protein